MEFLFLLVLRNRCVQKNYSTGDKILWLNLIGLLCVITNFQISVESALMDEWLGQWGLKTVQSQYSSFLELDALFAGMTMIKEMVNHNLGWESDLDLNGFGSWLYCVSTSWLGQTTFSLSGSSFAL